LTILDRPGASKDRSTFPSVRPMVPAPSAERLAWILERRRGHARGAFRHRGADFSFEIKEYVFME
jgi:hypothetical protein